MFNNYGNIGCGTLILLLLAVVGLFFLGVWIAGLLWGAIAVAVFGLPALTYWQMAGLMILLNLLLPHSTTNVRK